MHFYITGDTHRSFDRIEDFCYEYETTTEDVMIILGDAGINYWLDLSDKELKGQLSGMNITFFCVHGNHEARPWEAEDYEEKIWNEGIVYVEEQYPNILFAKDGEIYNFNGKKVMPIGGAYSIDKYYRIRNGLQHQYPPVQIRSAPRLRASEILCFWGFSFLKKLTHKRKEMLICT